jgi:hypothetical protein
MRKKAILLGIILFPALVYFFFELTQANFKKMPYYGPKKLDAKGDTIYYAVTDTFFHPVPDRKKISTYVALFLNPALRSEGYKLAGLYDFIRFKPQELRDVEIVIAYANKSDFDSLKINQPNIHPAMVNYTDRAQFLTSTFFRQKPIHVFDYFAVLVDRDNHIRGFYDPTFNAEIKRMIQEYKHLKIRDGYAQTQSQNNIEKK